MFKVVLVLGQEHELVAIRPRTPDLDDLHSSKCIFSALSHSFLDEVSKMNRAFLANRIQVFVNAFLAKIGAALDA